MTKMIIAVSTLPFGASGEAFNVSEEVERAIADILRVLQVQCTMPRLTGRLGNHRQHGGVSSMTEAKPAMILVGKGNGVTNGRASKMPPT